MFDGVALEVSQGQDLHHVTAMGATMHIEERRLSL